MRGKKITKEEFIQEAKSVHGDRYDYSLVGEEIFKSSKVKLICEKHKEFTLPAYRHLNGKGCQLCSLRNRNQKLRKPIEEIIKKFREVHGDRYEYPDLRIYSNKDTKLPIICKIHDLFFQSYSNHSKGKGCPDCGNIKRWDKRRADNDQIIANLKEKHGGKYDYSKVNYQKNSKKIEIICLDHGPFLQNYQSHLSGAGCPECGLKSSGLSRRLKNGDFIKKCKEVHQGKYEYDKTHYKTMKDDVLVKCRFHGYYLQNAWNHYAGHGCPFCSGIDSNFEISFNNFLKSDLKLQENEISLNNRSVISPLELDIYLKNKKIAIECDGLYWHSELQNSDKNYHLNKTNLCNKKGIRLIHIFESEWIYKSRAAKSQLRNILNLNKYKILVQKCQVREINLQIKNQFLEKYHIQGIDHSSVKLGLFYKNRLVAVMTFCENGVDNGWDMVRYATIPNFSIIDGEGRLLEYFEGKFSPKKIIGYSDLRWSSGDFYHNLGFNKVKQLNPNYWYFKNNGQNLCRHLNFEQLEVYDPQKTEWENAQDNGWNRIWDCGNLVFEKKYC